MQHNFEPVNFKLKSFLDVVNDYIRLDETERALWLLDNLPSYYRDYPPKEVVSLKNDLLKHIATPRLYSTGDFDCRIDLENKNNMDKTLRGILIIKDVKHFNEQNITPHIVDYGPGEYWLPLVLKSHNMKFTYDPIGLNEKAFNTVKPHIENFLSKDFKDRPVIYVATEIIEHLHHQEELKTEMLFNCGLADIVHVSTPKYCFDNRDIDWRLNKPEIGHLRTYTPKDFVNVVSYMFKEYSGTFYDSLILHSRLICSESKHLDKIVKMHEV